MNFSPLDNPIWNSLNSEHRSLATLYGSAGRFSPDVSPLVGMLDGTEGAFDDLALVLSDGTRGATFTAYPITVPAGWEAQQRVISQMVCTKVTEFRTDGVGPLGEADVPDMLELAAATEPGPFGSETISFGRYYGIRMDDGRLAAMAGERLALDRFVEISAVCTRAEFRGRGYASSLVSLIAARILSVGKVPFLHVKTENDARLVYEKIGFSVRKPMHVTAVKKI